MTRHPDWYRTRIGDLEQAAHILRSLNEFDAARAVAAVATDLRKERTQCQCQGDEHVSYCPRRND